METRRRRRGKKRRTEEDGDSTVCVGMMLLGERLDAAV